MRFHTNAALAGLALVLAAFISQPASAQWYVSGFGGGNFLTDANNTASGISIKSSYSTGFVGGGSVGYSFGAWRAEGEVAYRQNDFDKLTITDDGGLGVALGLGSLNGLSIGATGNARALSFMGNVFYDFDVVPGFTPYIGGGLGVARVSANNLRIMGVQLADDSTTVFAYQLGGGVSFEIAPQTSLFLEYRYFGTAKPSLTDVTGVSFDTEYRSHTVNVGLRISL
jgi:opacity protein-like surface antigen